MFVAPKDEDLASRPGRVAPVAVSGFRETIGADLTAAVVATGWHSYTGQRVRDTCNGICGALVSSIGEDGLAAELQQRGLCTERFPGNRTIGQIWSLDPQYGHASLATAQGRFEDSYGPVPETRSPLPKGVLGEIRGEWDDASATLAMGGAGADGSGWPSAGDHGEA